MKKCEIAVTFFVFPCKIYGNASFHIMKLRKNNVDKHN